MATTDTPAPRIEPAPDIKPSLVLLLCIFILGNLCNQGFTLVFQQIGTQLGAPEQASLITALPGIVLGIVCFIYGSLGDFVSLKRMFTVGIALLLAGSLLGFFCNFGNIWMVIVARCIQTAGGQVAGSVYLVLVARYLEGAEKVTFFGIFTAGFQLSTAIGVLAAGFLASLNWTILFLIPAVSVFFIPTILSHVPDEAYGEVHVDVPGFAIVAVALALLTIFFTYMNWWLLLGAVVFFVLFWVYIGRAKQPFITHEFFHNTRWLMSIGIFFILYFFNYSIAGTCNALGAQVYGMTSGDVSLMLLAAYIVATVMAVSSGSIDAKLGHKATIIMSIVFMICGFALAAACATAGPVAIGIAMAIVYAGIGLFYSPVVDTVVGTVAPDQSGRAIGMNDLALNVAGSIGIAIFGGMMGIANFSDLGLVPGPEYAGPFVRLFVIFCVIAVVGLVWYLFIMNKVTPAKLDVAEEYGDDNDGMI